MKKLLYTFLLATLVLPLTASAETSVFQGGTGQTAIGSGQFIVGDTTYKTLVIPSASLAWDSSNSLLRIGASSKLTFNPADTASIFYSSPTFSFNTPSAFQFNTAGAPTLTLDTTEGLYIPNNQAYGAKDTGGNTRNLVKLDSSDSLLIGESAIGTNKIPALSTNGFVKTSGSDGTLSVDTNTYPPAPGADSINTVLTWNGTNFTATGTPLLYAGGYIATSTTATSTFAGDLTVSGKISAGFSDQMVVSGVNLPSNIAINSNTQAVLEMDTNSDTASTASLSYCARSRGTNSSPAIVQNGDTLCTHGFAGYDGVDYAPGAYISAVVNGTPGSNDMPTRLIFATTPDGSGASVERATIINDGKTGVGVSTPTARFHVVGANNPSSFGAAENFLTAIGGNGFSSVSGTAGKGGSAMIWGGSGGTTVSGSGGAGGDIIIAGGGNGGCDSGSCQKAGDVMILAGQSDSSTFSTNGKVGIVGIRGDIVQFSSVPNFGGATTTKVVINNSGYLGHSTSTPWGRLSIGSHNGDTSIPSIIVASSSTGIATTTQFIVTNGRVGIATSSPTGALAVSGGIYTAATASESLGVNIRGTTGVNFGNGGFRVTSAAALSDWIFASAESASQIGNNPAFQFYDNKNNKFPFSIESNTPDNTFVLRSTGNVGIATSSPYAKLSVVGEAVATNFTATSTTAKSTFPYASTTVLSTSGRLYSGDNLYVGSSGSTGKTISMFASGGTEVTASADTYFGFPVFSTTMLKMTQGRLILEPLDNKAEFVASGANTQFNIYNSSLAAYYLSISTNGSAVSTTELFGNVGVGTSSPWKKFSVNGNVAMAGLTSSGTGNAVCISTNNEILNGGGGTCTPSSIKFKENITALLADKSIDTLMKLHPVEFDYKDKQAHETNHSYGLIAEEVEKVDKNLVDYDKDGGIFGLHFEKITGLLVSSIQNVVARVSGLEKKVDEQDKRIAELERIISEMKK